MGWYGATPTEQKQSRLEALKSGDDNEAQAEAIMPEIDPACSSLLELFFHSGQATSTGMGLIPLDWEKLRAWRLENKLELSIWEKETIIKMSEAYCAEYSRATDPQRPAPYSPEKEEDEIDEEAELRKALQWMKTIRSMGKN